jgi:hypothetical protein
VNNQTAVPFFNRLGSHLNILQKLETEGDDQRDVCCLSSICTRRWNSAAVTAESSIIRNIEKRRVGYVAANSPIRNDGQCSSPVGHRDPFYQPTGPTSMSFYRLIWRRPIILNSSLRFKIQSLFLAMDGATLFNTGSGVRLNE